MFRSSSRIYRFSFSLLLLSGCSTPGIGYLLQAAHGQMMIQNRARPIPEVVADERTPPRVKRLLSEIPSIKSYGESQGLKATSNYQDYVKLDGPAVSWVVSACEPLRFEPRRWSFPFVGSFTYVGWFDRDAAVKYAQEIRAEPQGWDVDVRGASAYSTLGWFRDPVLSTMLPEGAEAMGELVNVILHESVHATLYISGQSSFNESIASFAADRMAQSYLESHEGKDSTEAKAYAQGLVDIAERTKKLHLAYEELDRLYQSDRTREEKLAEKLKILSKLKGELGFRREINNATLIQFKTYDTGEPDFERVFKSCQENWPRFWKRLGALKASDFPGPQSDDFGPMLRKIAESGC